MVFPIIGQALAGGTAFFCSGVRWVSSPDGFHLVELLLRGIHPLDLFSFLPFLLLFFIDSLNIRFLFPACISYKNNFQMSTTSPFLIQISALRMWRILFSKTRRTRSFTSGDGEDAKFLFNAELSCIRYGSITNLVECIGSIGDYLLKEISMFR
jgi:hypothetical protein